MASNPTRSGGRALYWVTVLFVAAATIGVMLMYQNIAERKQEARSTAFKVVELDETTLDPAVWGQNFPRQYDGYKRTADNERTRYGGSEALPVAPGSDVLKAESKVETNPRLKTIFNGYAFALDYRERRGHAFMLHDQRETDRVKLRNQPGACLNCHASNVLELRKVGLAHGAAGELTDPLLSESGQAQLHHGFDAVNRMPYGEATQLVSHAITCLDCHDPATNALRITRPAFVEGIRALAGSGDPVPHFPSVEKWRKGARATPYDPNRDASRQELRSMTCGQCHVEYYFKGEGKTLTFPWHNGLRAEHIEDYYNEVGWNDWTHTDAKTPVLKAQHPEFELWSQGIHARAGVSCADCHMPYTREGAVKVSDHQIRSPLLNVARACQTCHNHSESEMLSRVATIQDRTNGLLDRAEIATVAAIEAIRGAMGRGVGDADLKTARDLHRMAQWRTDYINAENSMGFHAPQEAARILGEAIDYARQAEMSAMLAGAPRASAQP